MKIGGLAGGRAKFQRGGSVGGVRGGGLRVVQVRCMRCGAYIADAWVNVNERGNVLWDICVLCRRRGGWR